MLLWEENYVILDYRLLYQISYNEMGFLPLVLYFSQGNIYFNSWIDSLVLIYHNGGEAKVPVTWTVNEEITKQKQVSVNPEINWKGG